MGTAYQNMFRVGIIDKDFIKKDELKIIICTASTATGDGEISKGAAVELGEQHGNSHSEDGNREVRLPQYSSVHLFSTG